MRRHDPNRWQGLVLGIAGGVVGTVAMGGYWKAATALVGEDPRMATLDEPVESLEDIAVAGQHHQESESTTAAMGRMAYERIAGEPPASDETKALLSYVVHYAYGAIQGGFYGALSSGRGGRDLLGGVGFGAGLWALGDELAGSALGLAEGPGNYPVSQHLHRLGAHLVYGVATAAVTTVLRRIT